MMRFCTEYSFFSFLFLCVSVVLSGCVSPQAGGGSFADLEVFRRAYPEHVKQVRSNSIIFRDGTRLTAGEENRSCRLSDLLDSPDLYAQIAMDYFLIKPGQQPPLDHDPGRIRYSPFFSLVYGSDRREVESHLTNLVWMPGVSDQVIQITRVNDVHKRLAGISQILLERPHLHKFTAKTAGGYNWRVIAGTDRLSAHSWGIAIDLDPAWGDYWKWSDQHEYVNRIPLEIVEVFEAHGFIWGGRWFHYDSMHFEYRPELLDH